jgi:hypothetical protein
MDGRNVLSLTTLALGLAVLPVSAFAQSAKDIVGTWELVSSVNTAADGTKTDAWGPNPKGETTYERDGRFSVILTRSDLPKFASDNRMQGTPDENKAIVQGSNANYGTYSVANKVITQHIEGGTFPNWNGTDQKRTITSYTKDQMTFTLVQSMGGTGVTTWRRVK